ncbi:MAG: glycosyltransferase [Lachnospiraceae bacterium]|nr:glycosyltransferase [Lachnospiraceae bacterium]
MIRRALDYLKRNGAGPAFFAAAGHAGRILGDIRYSLSLKDERTGKEELEEQRRDGRLRVKISVLVPVYEPDPVFFRQMVNSVLAQTYGNFELVLADGSPAQELLATRISKEDPRIIYVRGIPGGGISDNSNTALYAAKGDAVALLDQDDLLEPDALYRMAALFDEGYDAVYTDEDKYVTGSGRYTCPYRKKDYDPDLLLSNNYICHLFGVRRDIACRAGGFNKRFDGAQDHDLILRCCDMAGTGRVAHIPRILYHWRIHEGSTAGNPMAKVYAYESGKRAVKNFLKEKGLDTEVLDTPHRGFFRVIYKDEVPKDSYTLFVDGKLEPVTENYEKILSSYLARKDIGIVGARIIGTNKKIICSGYEKNADGRIVSLFSGMDYRLPGYMNTAGLVMETEAVSRYACVVRNELLGCMEGDSYRICEKIRKQGYRVIIDPKVEFVKTR